MSGQEVARAAILRWYDAALAAVEPGAAVARTLESGAVNLPDPGRGRVVMVAVGKAADPMARAAAAYLGGTLAAGVVITKDGHLAAAFPPPIEAFEAAHPVPDGRGVAATERVLDLVRGAGPDDLVLALVSGGGSALLEAPRLPLALSDVAATTDLLLKAGAPIQHLNAVRTPLSRVKGGGLRAAAPNARFATLVLSDVLGNDLRTIASGPTIPAAPDAVRALFLLEQYRIVDRAPAAVVEVLERIASESGNAAATQADQDVSVIVGDNAMAVEAARMAVERDGLRARIAWTEREGEASELGREWVATCRQVGSDADVVLGGGEATVTVRGHGVGGRNTEFALAAALAMTDSRRPGWLAASLATDGQDGPTDVAGAIADPGTAERAWAAGIDPERALRENDSLAVFAAAGGLVAPGPTGTNVCDIYIGVREGAIR